MTKEDMNNKHQELIAEKVDSVRNQTNEFFYALTFEQRTEINQWLFETLQDTIDTVLERERERILKIISEEMSRGTMFGNKDEDIAYTLTSKLKKALTPYK